MKATILAVIFLSVISSSTLANQAISKLDNILFSEEWPGAQIFLKNVEQDHADACIYLSETEKRMVGRSFAIRRIVLALTLTKCEQKKLIAEKYISSKEPVLLASIIDLGTSLDLKSRQSISSKVQQVKSRVNDPLVKEAVDRFLNSLKPKN